MNTSREGYLLRTPVNKEFFTIENRQRTGWDANLPGHGMLVTRVDSTNVNIWNRNKVNCNPEHNYYELLRAGNSNSGDMPSDPFPGTSGNIMITNESFPSLRTWNGTANPFNLIAITENDNVISFNVVRDGELPMIVEDFESMPVSTGTTDQDVQGNFATWTFNKAGVRAPGEDKARGENSVMMKTPSLFYSTSPVYYNFYMASMLVFNMSSTAAKYSLEYTVENDSNGNPIWVTAPSSKGADAADAPGKSESILYWKLDLNNTQPARFRIYQRAGNKNVANYVDNLTFYYNGEPGGPQPIVTGDVNGDDEVNIADVNAIIDIILGKTVDEERYLRADVNGDGEVNIADVNAVISIILN